MAHRSTSSFEPYLGAPAKPAKGGLFDLPVPAANADPHTSHEAAAQVIASGQRDRNVILVAECVAAAPGRTSRELACTRLAIDYGLDRYECARRLSECETLGLVRRGGVRKCRESWKSAVTWWPIA